MHVQSNNSQIPCTVKYDTPLHNDRKEATVDLYVNAHRAALTDVEDALAKAHRLGRDLDDFVIVLRQRGEGNGVQFEMVCSSLGGVQFIRWCGSEKR
jgi:hypothetical protein